MKKGLVIKTTGSWFNVKREDGLEINCKIKGNFRIKGIKSTNPLAVGDYVLFKILQTEKGPKGETIGLITEVLDRKNYIVRRSQNLSKLSQVIAANIDQALLIVTLEFPVTSTTFIDRYLASAEAYRIPVILIFNKMDLIRPGQLKKIEHLIKLYEGIGYTCLKTSAETQMGMPELKALMINKKSLFSGLSGVGKSTIINLLQPGLNLKTKEISELYKTGKHTTTYSEMHELDFGGYIIDTPGIKAFGMLDMEDWEISHYFREIFELSSECQYNNCAHTHEPGCAVKQAVRDGKIAESRYASYIGLLGKDEKYRPPY